MSDSSVVPTMDFALLVGPFVLGTVLNTYLYGIVCAQFLSYAEYKFKDSLATRLMVAALFLIDTSHTFFEIWAVWDLCVTNYANPDIIATVNWVIPYTAVATGAAAFITQMFLGSKVVRLAKNKLLGVIILFFSLVSLGFALAVTVRVGQAKIFVNFDRYNILFTVAGWLISQSLADVTITVCLLWYLNSARTGFKHTDKMISRLMRGAVQTGAFACIFAMGDLVGYLLKRDTNLYVFFVFPLGRIYTNTLLETLNNRPSFQASRGSVIDMDTPSNARFRNETIRSAAREIHIRTEVYTTQDVERQGDNTSTSDVKYPST